MSSGELSCLVTGFVRIIPLKSTACFISPFWAATLDTRTFGHVRPVWSESSLDAFWLAKEAKCRHAENGLIRMRLNTGWFKSSLSARQKVCFLTLWLFFYFQTLYANNPQHYKNTPIQIYWKFYNQKKKENFQIKKKSDIFHILAQNIDCGYSLEQSQQRGSTGYPQSVFLGK